MNRWKDICYSEGMKILTWLKRLFQRRSSYPDYMVFHNMRMGLWLMEFSRTVRDDAGMFKTPAAKQIILDHAESLEREAAALLGMPPTSAASHPVREDGT